MKELFEYREALVNRLREATREFCDSCKQVNDPFAFMDGDWNLHQVASHVRDIDRLVYGARIRETLENEKPAFKSFDPDAWMEKRYKKEERFEAMLDDLLKNIEAVCDMLGNLPPEAWSRESRHETLGEHLTLQLWVERSLAHIEEHLQVLKKA